MPEKKQYSYLTAEEMLKNMRLMDDRFMNLVFDENNEAVELVLNIILERDDLKVKTVEVQKVENNPKPDGRGLVLDIYAEDADGKVYDIEIQRADYGADVKRARLHSAVLDSRLLKANEKFSEVNDSYVIFITENDKLGDMLPIYHIDRIIRETGKYVDDGNHIIYVNGEYESDTTAIGRLMHDFRCKDAKDMYYDELRRPVQHFKETEGGRSVMCKIWEDYGNAREAEGRQEGIKNDDVPGIEERKIYEVTV